MAKIPTRVVSNTSTQTSYIRDWCSPATEQRCLQAASLFPANNTSHINKDEYLPVH